MARLLAEWMWILTRRITVSATLVMPYAIVTLGISRFAHHWTQVLRAPNWTVLVHV